MTDLTFDWIAGLIGTLTIFGIIIGFYVQLKSIRLKAKQETDEMVNKAVAEAKVETESAFEFRQLKQSVDETNRSVLSLTGLMNSQMGDVQTKLHCHDQKITELTESTKQFHKRMDEHRKVDHRWIGTKENEMEDKTK
jgi:hypothetical protein